MKTKTAPKSHQAERSEAQPKPPLAEAPSEERSLALFNKLAKDYGPAIERTIAHCNREIEHFLLGDDAPEPSIAQPEPLTSLFKQEGQTPNDWPAGSDRQVSRPGSRLKPWACKCPRARVWASFKVELSATCHKCGSTFQRQ